MKAIFSGGLIDGEAHEIPEGLWTYRIPVIDCPVAVQDYLELEPAHLSYRMAVYRFSGKALVTVTGEVRAVIYTFDRMEP